MLHNTGPFGPNDVPVNVNSQSNMTSMSGRMNIGNNVNNLAKIPQQSPQATNPHFNLPEYPSYGLNMNAGLSPFQNFHHVGFQQNSIPQSSIHESWQSNMLPMNLNMQSEHSMLGFAQYGKPDMCEQSFNKSMLNVPQVHTKAFHKQMGMDVNYHYNLNPTYRPYADYNLDLSSKHKSDDVRHLLEPNIIKERIAPSPHYSEQIDLSNKHKMQSFTRPYLETTTTKSVIPHKQDNTVNINNDLSAQLQRSKDKHSYFHSINSGKIHSSLESRYRESELDLSKSLKPSTLNTNYQNLSADRYYKEQEMRSQSNDLLPRFHHPNNLSTNFPSASSDLRMYKEQAQIPQNLGKSHPENLNTSFPSITSDLRYYRDREAKSQNLEAILSKTQKSENLNTATNFSNSSEIFLGKTKSKSPNTEESLLKYPQTQTDLTRTDSPKASADLRLYKDDEQRPQNLEKTLPKPQQPDKLITNYQSINSDLRFYKDQDSRRRSLENTVKMIENILSHSSNSRKSQSIPYADKTDPMPNDKDKPELKDGENDSLNKSDINNSNTTVEGDSSVDNLSICDKSMESNANTSNELDDNGNEDDEMDDKDQSNDESNSESENDIIETTNLNDKAKLAKPNDDVKTDIKSESDESESDEDMKPSDLFDENDIKKEELVDKSDERVVVKVEVMPNLMDTELLNPFYRDVFGVQSEDTVNHDIIDAETSINVAKEVIRNGAAIERAYFECPHCSLFFNHPKRFLIHTKWHSFGLTNEKRMEVQKEKEMRKQMRKEARVIERMNLSEADASASGRKFNCRDCDKVFLAKASLKNHRQRFHPTRTRDCKICGKIVLGWMALRAHMVTHTCESGYQCDVCPKRFKHPHSLAKHRDTHLEKTHACPQCPKKFGSAMLLNVHSKTHERALRGATFRCTYCGKGFFESYSLQVHERTHRNERPYMCEICNTSFGTNSSLKRHLKVSHSTSKPFECSTCHRSFISEAIRDRHAMRNHGNPEDFKFVCKQCPCKYLKLKDLRKHMYKVHPKGKRKKKDQSDSE